MTARRSEFFDEIEVGQRRPPSRRRRITTHDIETYCALAGDPFRYWSAAFADVEEFDATRASEDDTVVPGNLLLSLQYGLQRNPQPLNAILALYVWEDIRYLRPVRAGDTVHVEWEVIEKLPRDPQYGVVRTLRTVRNQRDEVVMTVVERTRHRTRAAWEALKQQAAADRA